MSNIRYCEFCGAIIDEANVYGSGRFCNETCKNKFVISKARCCRIKQMQESRKIVYCLACNKPFSVIPSEIGKRKFCSLECSSHYKYNKCRNHTSEQKQKVSESMKYQWSNGSFSNRARIEKRYCIECGKLLSWSNKRNLCKDCRRANGDYHTSDGISRLRESGKKVASNINNRSKNEILFADLINSIFTDSINNKPIFNGWDADIIIPSLNIAILWNGKWHYEDIFGRLNQIENRDRIKYNEIVKAGYMPYIIVDLGKFSEIKCKNEFNKFLNFVDILNEIKSL